MPGPYNTLRAHEYDYVGEIDPLVWVSILYFDL
jgi:hypothetical protein